MTISEFETLHTDLAALRADVDRHFAEVEAKLDAKPSTVAMFTGIILVWFGMAGVIASTVIILHTLGFIK